ncbi:MAG: endonuclease/exonuclease/phosphatase family protein [Lentisphaeraceae bacterium]|nr:endonuclease/exonuclease/phosphatase family protein [Lentisphaeraceae bacterium]
MQKKLSLLLLFALLLSCQSNPERRHLKVLTFNILGGRNVDGAHNLKRIAKIINTMKPDIVAMQEVDKNTRRIKKRNITKEIAELTGMHYAFGKAMNFDGGEYGEAILSKEPILEVINHPLPAQENAEPRAALEAIVQFPHSNKKYSFIATHLDHLESNSNRLMQVKAINKILSAKKQPYILAGDLNATPNSKTMKLINQHLDFGNSRNPTYPVKSPKLKIDWIGVDKLSAWRLDKVYTATEFKSDKEWLKLLEITSDHLPMMKEYTLE